MIAETVNAGVYPDGPCLGRETRQDICALLDEMERVECVEGKADPSGGFWKNTNFPFDRPALLLLLPKK